MGPDTEVAPAAPARVGLASSTVRAIQESHARQPRAEGVAMTDLHIPAVPTARGNDALAGNLDDSVFNRLLKERIIFLGSEVTDTVANRICAQLILLAAEDSERDIYLYINSPGGSVYSGMAIYDTMQF